MKTNTIRIVAAIADRKMVTLYKEDGDTIIIKQGDHRLNDLLDAVIPITTKGEVAVISLEDFSVYSAYERRSEESGTSMVKFFKVARKKLASFFGSKEEEPEVPVGSPLSQFTVAAIESAIQGRGNSAENAEFNEELLDAQREDAVAEKLVKAPEPVLVTEPVPEPTPEPKLEDHFRPAEDDEVAEEDTIVAVIGDTVIPNIEKIRPLINRAVQSNSTVAVDNFLKRAASMMGKRSHSVEDLLKFLEQGDLPLAEDGSIIAYKMLRYKTQGNREVFVDCHTRKIPQKVGSYVCVDEKLVDTNRRNECSNGLHIARRGYLSGFGGDLCVLTKIAPEDVVTVPHGDANKVRVMGYHILAVLSSESMAALKANKPITNDSAALSQVYQAIKGNHIGRLEKVQVTKQLGEGIVVTKLKSDAEKKKELEQVSASEMAHAKALDDSAHGAVSVDPKEINKRVNAEYEKQIQNESEVASTVEEALADIENEDDSEDKRVSEEVENLTEEDKEALEEMAPAIIENLGARENQMDPTPVPEEIKVAAPAPMKAQTPAQEKKLLKKQAQKEKEKAKIAAKKKADEAEAQAAKEAAKNRPRSKAPASKKKPSATVSAPKEIKTGTQTKMKEARDLYQKGDYAALREFKKRTKKGWSALGFTDKEVEIINPEVG